MLTHTYKFQNISYIYKNNIATGIIGIIEVTLLSSTIWSHCIQLCAGGIIVTHIVDDAMSKPTLYLFNERSVLSMWRYVTYSSAVGSTRLHLVPDINNGQISIIAES